MRPQTHPGALALLLTLATAACSGEDVSLRDALDALPRDTTPYREPAPPPFDTLPAGGAAPDTVPVDTAGVAGDTSALPIPFPEALDTEPWIPLGQPVAPGEWTAGQVRARRPGVEMTVHTGARTASHPEFDRVVLEFAGDALPGYELEYVDRPVRQCGSGDPVEVAGDAWLLVRLTPSQAHDERGRATIAGRQIRPALRNVLELRMICDFEGQVEWVLGVRSPARFRVLELSAPARLVVDVQS